MATDAPATAHPPRDTAERLTGQLLRALDSQDPENRVARVVLDALGVLTGLVAGTVSPPGRFTVIAVRGDVPTELVGRSCQLPAEPGAEGPVAALLARSFGLPVELGDSAVSFGEPPVLVVLGVARSAGLDVSAAGVLAAWGTAVRLESLDRRCAELEQARHEKEQLAGLLLHDLRNPLMVALTNLEYLREAGCITDADTLAAIADSEDSIGLAVDHVSGLLDIARMDEAGLPCVRRLVPVAELIHTVVGRFAFSSRRRQVRLTTDLHAAGEFALDEDLFARILHNLLTTLMRVTPANGWIEVRAEREGERLALVVASSGPAVPPVLRPLLFEKHHRLSPAGTPDPQFGGLGLYFVKLATEAHGGTVRLREDAGPGGLVFIVEIPAGPVPAP